MTKNLGEKGATDGKYTKPFTRWIIFTDIMLIESFYPIFSVQATGQKLLLQAEVTQRSSNTKEEMEKNRKSSTGLATASNGGSGKLMREVKCPTCTVHLQVVSPGIVLGAEQAVGNIAPAFAFGGAGAHPRRFNRFYDFIIASHFKD